MLYGGASVEDVKAAIDKKEEEKRLIQEKAKKEAIEEHKTRDIKQRVETAEALAKAGVISKEDLENIKKEAEKEMNALKDIQNKQETEQNASSNENSDEETDKNN